MLRPRKRPRLPSLAARRNVTEARGRGSLEGHTESRGGEVGSRGEDEGAEELPWVKVPHVWKGRPSHPAAPRAPEQTEQHGNNIPTDGEGGKISHL